MHWPSGRGLEDAARRKPPPSQGGDLGANPRARSSAPSLRRQACYVAVIAVAGGTCEAFTGGPLHEAISYGIAIATGTLIGFGLANR